ncbi:MAG: hypothetical protein AB8B92_02665 [Gammaproteobacteria bacterium]
MKFLITLLSAFILVSTPVFANDLENALMELNEKKKTMIANSMEFTGNQDEVFWAVYSDYEKELDSIIKDEYELIQKYNSKYKDNTISEQSASNMLAKIFRIQGRELQIKQIYLGKFQEVLPKNQVLRFYQIDNKVDALIGYDLAKLLPLVGADM